MVISSPQKIFSGNSGIFLIFVIYNRWDFFCFQSNCFHDKLYEILEMSPPSSPDHTTKESQNAVPVFEMQFPSLYVY